MATLTKRCKHNDCKPETHLTCKQCNKQMPWRWDCSPADADVERVSRDDMPCYQCSNEICSACCKSDPKLDWETFHNRWIAAFNPSCHGCKDKLYHSEGFAVKVDGQLVGFCSHACWEEHDCPEDDDWGCSVMHPPKGWLDNA